MQPALVDGLKLFRCRRAKVKNSGVVIERPVGFPRLLRPGDDGGSASSESDAGSEASVASQDSVASLLGSGDDEPAAAADAQAEAPRQTRAVPFGPWTMSSVYARGQFTGYGGNCNCHFGSHLACKKPFKIAVDD